MELDVIKARLVKTQDTLAAEMGQRIKQLRNAKGLSQQALASKLALSRAAVTQWENGQATCNYAHALELEKILGTDVSFILYGREAAAPVGADTYEEVFIRIRASRGEISITTD